MIILCEHIASCDTFTLEIPTLIMAQGCFSSLHQIKQKLRCSLFADHIERMGATLGIVYTESGTKTVDIVTTLAEDHMLHERRYERVMDRLIFEYERKGMTESQTRGIWALDLQLTPSQAEGACLYF